MKKVVAAILFVCIISTLLASCSVFECKCDTCDRKCEGCEKCNGESGEEPESNASNVNSGCKKDDYFPEGYTGGWMIEWHSTLAYYWVETYEECVAAIEQLKSHGSTFEKKLIFTYEGDLFDTKYCFTIDRKKADKIKYGEDPFDRYAEDVVVMSVAFYDDVSIDELIFSKIAWYECYSLETGERFEEAYAENPNVLEGEFETYTKSTDYVKNPSLNRYMTYVEGKYPSGEDAFCLAIITSEGRNRDKTGYEPIPETGLYAIINSMVIVE